MQKLKKLFAARDMTTGKPWKNILFFTVPMLIGNVFQQTYSTVDAIIVGRYVGDDALAAVGSTIPILFLMLVLFIGISAGAGVMVSQYFGAKKREELSHTIGTSITTIVISSIFIMAFAPFGTRSLLYLLNTPEAIIDWGVIYINIQLWGILALALFNILAGILRGLGDSFSALLYLAVSSVLNIVLDLLFIVVFKWGVAGASAATVIVQFIAAVLCFQRLMKMRDIFDMNRFYFKPSKIFIKQVMKLGLPIGASQAVFSLAMLVVQPLANNFGALFIACNVIIMRIDGFVMMPNFSFGTAVTVFTGQNVGAGKLDRVRQGTRQCVYMAAGTAVIMVAVILFFGRSLAGLFTQTDEILNMSIQMLRILAGGYIAFAFGIVFWSVIRGAGDAVTPMWASFITTIAIRVPVTYLLVYILKKPEALFYSLLITWVLSALFAFIAYSMGRWRSKGLVASTAE